jgi:hypothetical protein
MADFAWNPPPRNWGERRKVESWAYRVAHKDAKLNGATGEDAHEAGLRAQFSKRDELKGRKWGPIAGPVEHVPEHPADMSRF